MASPEHDIPDRQRASLLFVSHLRELEALKIFAMLRSDVAYVASMRRCCVRCSGLQILYAHRAEIRHAKVFNLKNGTTMFAYSYRERVAMHSLPYCVSI
jgi:hypothetical protein